MSISVRATDQTGADFLGQARTFLRGLLGFLGEEESEAEHGVPMLTPTHGAQMHGSSVPIPRRAGDQSTPMRPNNQQQQQQQRRGAGVMFVSPSDTALFVKRSGHGDHAGTWAFPGGHMEGNETPEMAARREAQEEIGDCDCKSMVQADQREVGGTHFTTFLSPTTGEFRPKLNDEHTDFSWRPLDKPPLPLHPGVQDTLKSLAMDPLTGKGQKIMSAMTDQYGPEKGKEVFYASKNKGNISGVDVRPTAGGAWRSPRWSRDQQLPLTQPQGPEIPRVGNAPQPGMQPGLRQSPADQGTMASSPPAPRHPRLTQTTSWDQGATGQPKVKQTLILEHPELKPTFEQLPKPEGGNTAPAAGAYSTVQQDQQPGAASGWQSPSWGRDAGTSAGAKKGWESRGGGGQGGGAVDPETFHHRPLAQKTAIHESLANYHRASAHILNRKPGKTAEEFSQQQQHANATRSHESAKQAQASGSSVAEEMSHRALHHSHLLNVPAHHYSTDAGWQSPTWKRAGASDFGTSEGARKAAWARRGGGGQAPSGEHNPMADHHQKWAQYHTSQSRVHGQKHVPAAQAHSAAATAHRESAPNAGLMSKTAYQASMAAGISPEHLPHDSGTSEGAKKAAQTRKVTGSVGGTRHIETKPGSGTYVPLGKFSVHKWEQGVDPGLHNIIHHTNNEKQANSAATKLWEKTGTPHITKHTEYLR